MIRNYLLLAYRNLIKEKWFSIFNISGLAIGMAVALLILNYVSFEFSYDKMHEKRDRIYRVESWFYEGNELTDQFPTASFGYAPAMKENMTGIEDYVRIELMATNRIVRYQEQKFRENSVVATEPSFFRIFSFKLLEGDPNTALTGPNKVVITKRMVSKYFGTENPIGKILSISTTQQELNCEVTGVLEDLPTNSHFNFDFFISWKTLPQWLDNFWYMHETYTYLLLAPSADPRQLEDKFPAMAEKYKTEEALKEKKWAINLQPIQNIHLTPQKQYEKETKGNRKAINILILVAFAILIIAWVNYINLTIARSLERAKEIGIRKVSGAVQKQLISQFMIDSLVVNLVSFLIAVVAVVLLMPLFSQLINKEISFIILKEPLFWAILSITFVGGFLLSGFYPAFVLSSIKPILVLKGKYSRSQGAGKIRKALVVIQFAASMILISGTIIVFAQLKYLINQPLNFNPDRIVAIRFPAFTDKLSDKMLAFSREIKSLPEVKNTCLSGCVPGIEIATFYANYRASDPMKQNKLYEMMPVDYDFTDTYGLKIVAGRGFDKDFKNDINRIVINEAAARSFGFTTNEEAIGQKIMLETQKEPVEILGIVKDYHHLAANKVITPSVMLLFNRIPWLEFKYMSVKLNSDVMASSLKTIENIWTRFFPNSTCDFHFIDQEYQEQFQQDRRFGVVFGVFASLALFISTLGLWVLTLFASHSRSKEMGLKKSLGASVPTIIVDLSKEFVILIGIAMLVGIPVSYLVMKNWLENFAYKTDLSWWIFALSGLLALGIALLTVSWQSWKAATRNPVEALRDE